MRPPAPTCEVCGTPIPSQRDRCTNQRCLACHGKHCTPGGATSPGHGRGWPTKPRATAPEPPRLLSMQWDDEPATTVSFETWAADNAEDAATVAEVAALTVGAVARFGGGAAPIVTITRIT